MLPGTDYAPELDAAILAATEAGRVVRDLYDHAATATYAKADGSPVTDADLASDRIIRAILAERFPTDPILTEEGEDDPARLAATRCWIVDPIDGTDQFIRRTGEFDVLIALVLEGRPVVAVGYQPATGLLCAAAAGRGARTQRPGDADLRPFRLDPLPADAPPRVVTSVWFGAPANVPTLSAVTGRLATAPPETQSTGFSPRLFLPERPCDALIGLNSSADQTMAWEWDFAVADLFTHEAGGLVTDLHGRSHRYNKAHPRNAGGLLATVDPATHARLLDALRPTLPAG